jgi:hypothetical protein
MREMWNEHRYELNTIIQDPFIVFTKAAYGHLGATIHYLYLAIRHDGHATLRYVHNEQVREWSWASRSAHSRRTASANQNYRCTVRSRCS